MPLRTALLIANVALCAVSLFGQADSPFQVRYFSNLTVGDSVINITNTGASSTVGLPTQNGNICANVYAFAPDEQLISCCSCPITPNALVSLSAKRDLISNTLTPAIPTSIVVKILFSTGVTACDASTPGPAPNVLAVGGAAWGTTLHALPLTVGGGTQTYGITETPFTPATLGPTELNRITMICMFNQINGSGFGICHSCRTGGLGGARQ